MNNEKTVTKDEKESAALADEKKIDCAANKILTQYKKAFEELAK